MAREQVFAEGHLIITRNRIWTGQVERRPITHRLPVAAWADMAGTNGFCRVVIEARRIYADGVDHG